MFAPLAWLRGYFSVRTPNAEVHAYADSQFGHVFAHAPTRKQAAYLLQLALKQLRVVGEIHSNVPYVRELVNTPDFLANKIDTGWLDKLIASNMQLEPPSSRDIAVCGALLKVHMAIKEATSKLLNDYISRNAAPPPELLQTLVEMKVEFIWSNNKFVLEVFRHSSDLYTVACNGSLLQAKLVITPGGSFVCSFAGESHKFHYDLEPGERIRMVCMQRPHLHMWPLSAVTHASYAQTPTCGADPRRPCRPAREREGPIDPHRAIRRKAHPLHCRRRPTPPPRGALR